MKLTSLLRKLKEAELEGEEDPEMAHLMADEALLDYINNVLVEKAFDAIVKRYD